MKLLVGIILFIWVLCGLVGAWRFDALDLDHWQTIARGPITLAKAFNDKPVSYPGP